MTILIKIIKKLWFVPIVIIAILFIVQKQYLPDFSFYKSDKVALMDTPVLVKEVRQIGELITSEYYGEVYGSLLEYYNNMPDQELKNPTDSIKRNFPYVTEFRKSYYTNSITRSQMRNLVYIGRGWVKAGIDLRKISSDDIQLSNDTLYLSLPKTEILVRDINPWFIKDQETSIKGFEIFKERRKSWKFTDAEVKAVKNICKEKLVADARKNGILPKSDQTAKTVMINFLKLLGFKHIIIR